MVRLIVVLAAAVSVTACASIVNDPTQALKLETKTDDGTLLTGTACTLGNDYGVASARSGDTVQVHRSDRDLEITCRHPGQADASARAISRVDGGLAVYILLGGVIGAIIDHNRGTAYTYPTWVQLVFGKTLVFDRSAEKEGQPVLGTEPTANATK